METEIKYIDNLCVRITDGSHFSPEDDEKGLYPMYSVKDMEYNSFSNQNCKHIGQEVFEKLAKADCRPLKDDIVIAKDGSYLKYVFKVKDDMDACILSSIAILRPNKKVINPDYFVYLMRSASVKNAMANYVSGSALPRIILSDFKKMKIAICANLNKQKQIASILSAYDSQIENNQKRIKLLEQMAENLYKEWFVRFRFPGYENAEFEGGVPKGWRMEKMENIAKISAGGDAPKDMSDTYSKDYPFPVFSNGIKDDGLYGYCKKATIPGDSITISARGTVGYVTYREEPFLPIVRLISLHSFSDGLFPVWLFFYLKNDSIDGYGTSQQQITIPFIEKKKVIVPPKNLQVLFNDQVTFFFSERRLLKKQNDLLTHQRDLLLPRLMSGKLSI